MSEAIKCDEIIPYRNCCIIAADVCKKGINKNNDIFERCYVGIDRGPHSDGYPYWHNKINDIKGFILPECAKKYYNDNKTYLSRNCVYKNVQIIKLEEYVIETIT